MLGAPAEPQAVDPGNQVISAEMGMIQCLLAKESVRTGLL